MKKKIFFLFLVVATLSLVVTINHTTSCSNLKTILQNVEALASDSEAGGASNVVGRCKDEKDECKKKCPGTGCTTTYSGTSGKDGPLEFVSGTCKCGHTF